MRSTAPGASAGERARSEAEERLRLIIERLPDGIVIVGDDGCVRFANPSAQSLFGRSAGELVGRELGFPEVAGETTEIEVLRPGGAVTFVWNMRDARVAWSAELDPRTTVLLELLSWAGQAASPSVRRPTGPSRRWVRVRVPGLQNAAASLVMAALVVVLAVVTAVGVFLWSLITGRKPVIRFGGPGQWSAMAAHMQARARSAPANDRPRSPTALDVIDVEVREVPDRQIPQPRD